MRPLSYLQNAILVACVFGTYLLADSWWGWLWLVFWMMPDGKCKCEEEESSRIIKP